MNGGLQPWHGGIEPVRQDLDLLDGNGGLVDDHRGCDYFAEPASSDKPVVIVIREQARPPVNVTLTGPGAGGVAAIAVIKAMAAIPAAVITGWPFVLRTLLTWTRRAIPGDGDRAAVLAVVTVLLTVWLGTVAVLAPWRLNLIVFGLLAAIGGLVGAITGGHRDGNHQRPWHDDR